MIEVAPEVREALSSDGPVVALETTLVAHGFPGDEGLAVALESERRVRVGGAVPATVGILDGAVRVGLAEAELERFASAGTAARKAGPRDLAACLAQGAVGATTVGGTLAVCAVVGIRFLGTGGIGGVHRSFAVRPDVSPDLAELARVRAVVVSSGVKSLLDVPATVEVLETLGVPVLGWQTTTLPLFYSATGGPPLSLRVDSADEATAVARAHWQLGRGGLLVAQAPPESIDVDDLLETALAAAEPEGVSGQDVTPFVLAALHRESGGATVRVNKRLVADNAELAARLAAAYAS